MKQMEEERKSQREEREAKKKEKNEYLNLKEKEKNECLKFKKKSVELLNNVCTTKCNCWLTTATGITTQHTMQYSQPNKNINWDTVCPCPSVRVSFFL